MARPPQPIQPGSGSISAQSGHTVHKEWARLHHHSRQTSMSHSPVTPPDPKLPAVSSSISKGKGWGNPQVFTIHTLAGTGVSVMARVTDQYGHTHWPCIVHLEGGLSHPGCQVQFCWHSHVCTRTALPGHYAGTPRLAMLSLFLMPRSLTRATSFPQSRPEPRLLEGC